MWGNGCLATLRHKVWLRYKILSSIKKWFFHAHGSFFVLLNIILGRLTIANTPKTQRWWWFLLQNSLDSSRDCWYCRLWYCCCCWLVCSSFLCIEYYVLHVKDHLLFLTLWRRIHTKPAGRREEIENTVSQRFESHGHSFP